MPTIGRQGVGLLEGRSPDNYSPQRILLRRREVVLTATTATDILRSTPSRPNSPGVLSELLLQPLRSVHRRTYLSRYRTAAFVSFTSAPEDLPVAPGVYAVAYRFVKTATGQETGMAELVIFSVG